MEFNGGPLGRRDEDLELDNGNGSGTDEKHILGFELTRDARKVETERDGGAKMTAISPECIEAIQDGAVNGGLEVGRMLWAGEIELSCLSGRQCGYSETDNER